MIKIVILGYFFMILICYSSFSQKKEHCDKCYITSYNYIKSISDVSSQLKNLNNHCLKNVGDDLYISTRMISNDIKSVLCDYIQKKYNLNKSCIKLFGEGDKIIDHVLDSIKANTKPQENVPTFNINEILPQKYFSDKSIGNFLFYSQIKNKGLLVELMSFCNDYYSIDSWYGSSKLFYFTFDDNCNILNIYTGIRHYQ